MQTVKIIIKSIAYIIAVVFATVIISTITFMLLGFSEMVNYVTSFYEYEKMEDGNSYIVKEETFDSVNTLEILVDSYELEIYQIQDDEIKIITYTAGEKRIEVEKEYNRIKIYEEEDWFLGKNNESIPKVQIYIPVGMIEEISINSGDRNVKIEGITNLEKLYVIGKDGKTELSNLDVGYIYAGTGQGNMSIKDSTFGKAQLYATLGSIITENIFITEKIALHNTVAKIELNIRDSKDNYKIYAQSYRKNVMVDGEEIQSNTTIGNGYKTIDTYSTIGNIEINFGK